jgi:two-component system cell cycle sensor histidine kinase/response regulator CckA
MLLATALLTLLAGVLVWWATWWMLRRQLSPMIAATRTMDTLSGKGQPLQLIPVTSNDEIAELIGGFNRLLGVVTQREEALKASEQSLQLFIDHAPAALAMFDRDMRYMSASRRWLSDYGLGGRELRGLCHYDVFPEIPEFWKEIHRRALAGEELRSEAERFDRADGSTQWIRWEVLPWRDPRGNVGGIVIFSEDLSEIKRGEEARLRLEAQLRESQKMEALGTLAGGVAHDFNNVLAMILGNVELARQDVGADHPAQVSLEEIAKASRRAKDLVQQILSFGRRQKLERNATSLSLVVVETARLMRATLPATVRLNVDCAPDVPAVLADATQIKQVLVNLCGNAADAIQSLGRPGSIDVSLHAHVQTEGMPGSRLRPGRYACLTVSDTGQGMDEATRAHMFEPFFTTKPMGKGTGLGLAVVHGIVQAHEASVEVESAPGAGSTFRIFFPASDAPVEALDPSEAGTEPIDGAGKRVLYVDDEEAIVFLMKRLLERQGFRVSGYTDPQEALADVRANPAEFDLAVTDYNMPGMDGLLVARALKEIRADLPVVLASGYITEDLRAKAPEAGVRELIYKPNTVDDLCAAVARCANAKSGKDKPS